MQKLSVICFAVLTFVMLTAGTMVAPAATIRVPDDQATVVDAIGAASAGDTILITNSDTYPGAHISKTVMIEAAPGVSPTIASNGSGGFSHVIWCNQQSVDAKIGSISGGVINIDMDQQDPSGVINGAIGFFQNDDTGIPAGALTFENLNINGDTGGHHAIQIGVGVGGASDENFTFNFRRLVVENVSLTNIVSIQQMAGSVVNVEQCQFNQTTEGVAAIQSFFDTSGELNLTQTEIDSGAAAVYLASPSDNSAPWDVNIHECWLKISTPGWRTVTWDNNTPGTTLDVTRSIIVHDNNGSGVYFSQNTDQSTMTVDHCDVFAGTAGHHLIRIEVGATNNTATVTNTNMNNPDKSGTVLGFAVFDNDSNSGTSNYNNYDTGSVFGVNLGANDISPGLDPNYFNVINGDVRYSNSTLLVSDDSGGPIGAFINFPELGKTPAPNRVNRWSVY